MREAENDGDGESALIVEDPPGTHFQHFVVSIVSINFPHLWSFFHCFSVPFSERLRVANVPEDTALLGGCFGGGGNDPALRKRTFNAAAGGAHADGGGGGHVDSDESFHSAEEDHGLTGPPAPAAADRRADPGAAEGASDSAEETPEWFEPGLVYTFDFFSHVLDLQKMSAYGFDVVPIVNRNPILCMARLKPAVGAEEGAVGEHLWRFEIYHERMVGLSPAEEDGEDATGGSRSHSAPVAGSRSHVVGGGRSSGGESTG